MMLNKFQCVKEKIIENCPSCIKMHKDRIYVSTYDFVNEKQQLGKIQVYDQKMELIYETNNLQGVTDFKIVQNLIYIATVGSQLIIGDVTNPEIKIIQTIDFKEQIKFLYLDVKDNNVIIGGDQGEVVYYDQQYQVFKPHKFSTWALSFDNEDYNIYYSGGDDNLFIKYDKRDEHPVLINKKTHSLGVTYIHSQDNLIVTGSFDGRLRIFDKRNLNNLIEEFKREGCIWRIVQHDNQYLLAISTESKYEIVQVENNQIQQLQEFSGYGSLTYGCDWVDNKISTISFYDKLIKLYE